MRLLPWFASVLLACEGLVPGNAPAQAGASEPAIVAPAALRAALAAGVRRLGANEARFEVDAFVAALAVEELAAGAGGLRVEPAIEGGAPAGYRVVEVTPGSAYALLGLQAGDVIEAIGEVRLDSPGRAAGIVGSLGRGGTLAVVREGVGFTIEVRIAGGVSWAELLRTRTGAPAPVVAEVAIGAGLEGQVAEDSNVPTGLEGHVPGGSTPEEPVAVEPVTTGRPAASGKAPQPTIKPTTGGGATSGGAKPGSGSGAGSSAGGTGAQCATAASCTLEKRVFDAAVADPGKLLRQAEIAPAKGGYKLTRVTPGSTVAGLGFRAGDVIVSVNGARLDDDVAALGLYMGLGSTKNYRVVYERNGVRATKAIAIR